jgi:gliding motility-associated-like protein
MKIRTSIAFFLCFSLVISVSGQTPAFIAPDTVCVNGQVTITNASIGGTTYFWSFCDADLTQVPQATNLGNISGILSEPVFMDIVSEGGNYYGLLVDHYPGDLIRLDFGNSLLNAPVATSLGNFGGIINAGYGSEGIQVVNNNGTWYALIVGGDPASLSVPKIVQVNFGATITNPAPVATDWGNLGGLLQPIGFYVFNDNNNWYGFTVNATNNTITRFNFGTSFDVPPTAVNLGNPGGYFDYPTSVSPLKDPATGNWSVFITNGNSYSPSALERLDFGNSLLNNTPTAVNLGNPGNVLQEVRDIKIIQQCDQIIGFIADGTGNDLIRLDFNNNLLSVPTAVSLGNIGNFDFAHSLSKLFRVGADLYTFVPNVNNNTITRVRFAGCTSSTIPNSTLQNPPAVSYSQPGTYHINLIMDDGLSTQSSFCKVVTVLNPPTPVPPLDSILCADSLLLISRFVNTPNTWSDGSTHDTLVAKASGTYWVNTNFYGCTGRDSFSLNLKTLPPFTLGNDSSFCQGDSLKLQYSPGPGSTYTWQDGSATPAYTVRASGQYKLTVTNALGCVGADSINVSVRPQATIDKRQDTSFCAGGSVPLTTTVQNADSVRWSPGTGLSNPAIASPLATPAGSISYILTAYRQNCSLQDTVNLTLLSNPVTTVSADTQVCTGGSVQLFVSGADHYVWSPSSGLTDTAVANPVASPDSSVYYHVLATGTNTCTGLDSVLVSVRQADSFRLVASPASICKGEASSLTIESKEGYSQDSYEWLFDIGGQSPAGSVVIISPAGSASYSAIGIDKLCNVRDTVSASVEVLASPEGSATKSNDIGCVQGEAQLTATGGIAYRWYPGQTLSDSTIADPVARTDSSTLYFVTVKGENGCTTIDTIRVLVTKGAGSIGFPVASAFTPNGDGHNDCFGIKYWGYIASFEMSVFNRWGQRVFYAQNPDACWDGTYNGKPQPAGTYVYMIKANTLCGIGAKEGTVMLIR